MNRSLDSFCQPPFVVPKASQFPDCKTVSDRDGHPRDEGFQGIDSNRPIEGDTSDRIRSIEDDERDAELGGGFHCESDSGNECVEPRPNVLDVADDDFDSIKHLGSWLVRSTVQ